MRATLLRVGIDKGNLGVFGPIFEDGSFEYIPIPECSLSKEDRAYKHIIGRSGKPLSIYLPERCKNIKVHYDPEFETFTYGDPTRRRKSLSEMKRDDILVFYAGLTPYKNKSYREGLYIIGYFTVEDVIDFNELSEEEIRKYCKLYPNNAHMKRIDGTENLVLVVGQKGKDKSKLLSKAILIGGKDGRVTREMEGQLGISGSILRSIPKMIGKEKYLNNLKRILRRFDP
ncbi:MAG: hypothetical protein ACPLYF_01560 [Fervidobacterium sp.]